MPAIHPSLFADYRIAKKAAGALAAAIAGCTLLQNSKGKPRVILGSRTQDFPSWLSAYSFLHQIRTDQLKAEAARKQRQTDSIPWAKVLD